MEAISRTKRLLPQKRKNHKIREPLVLKGSLEIICDSSIKLRKKRKIDIFKNYEANGVEKIQRKLEIFSTLISKKSNRGPFK